jgi:hypothetical protein
MSSRKLACTTTKYQVPAQFKEEASDSTVMQLWESCIKEVDPPCYKSKSASTLKVDASNFACGCATTAVDAKPMQQAPKAASAVSSAPSSSNMRVDAVRSSDSNWVPISPSAPIGINDITILSKELERGLNKYPQMRSILVLLNNAQDDPLLNTDKNAFMLRQTPIIGYFYALMLVINKDMLNNRVPMVLSNSGRKTLLKKVGERNDNKIFTDAFNQSTLMSQQNGATKKRYIYGVFARVDGCLPATDIAIASESLNALREKLISC